MQDNDDQLPILGRVSFAQARFTEIADFTRVRFTNDAIFSRAEFIRQAWFAGSRFSGDAQFMDAQFAGETNFASAQFVGTARFHRADFAVDVRFSDASFTSDARFDRAQFRGSASFSAQFGRNVTFDRVLFGRTVRFRNAKFTGNAGFSDVKFTENAGFDSTQFSGTARFDRAQFGQNAGFGDAEFLGGARFMDVRFDGDARFDRVQFGGYAEFAGAHFSQAWFYSTRFAGSARFDRALFNTTVRFSSAKFIGSAGFSDAKFTGKAEFDRARFSGSAKFDRVQFGGPIRFSGTQFRDASLVDVRFENVTSLGPLVAESLNFNRAQFVRALVIEAAAMAVSCRDAKWSEGVTLRIRYASLDLERAIFTLPSFVTGSDQPFEIPSGGHLNEGEISNRVLAERSEFRDPWMPILASLRGSDAANLSVTDVDLSNCRFANARLLDQLRLEGRCIFDHPPQGVRTGLAWPPAWRWSSRQSIAEERYWRATTRKYSGWQPNKSAQAAEVRPERLAGLYRQLRKAQEDAKNEPGAADFYYGEMEMRRKAATTPRGERVILWLYWLISGYGLRALRPFAALTILAAVITAALVGWGLAANVPPQHLLGTITSNSNHHASIDATLNTAVPSLPSVGSRWTAERAWTALEVNLDSMVFRTTDQPLTAAGIWITDAARILGPVLLALALLAVRNRVKRLPFSCRKWNELLTELKTLVAQRSAG